MFVTFIPGKRWLLSYKFLAWCKYNATHRRLAWRLEYCRWRWNNAWCTARCFVDWDIRETVHCSTSDWSARENLAWGRTKARDIGISHELVVEVQATVIDVKVCLNFVPIYLTLQAWRASNMCQIWAMPFINSKRRRWQTLCTQVQTTGSFSLDQESCPVLSLHCQCRMFERWLFDHTSLSGLICCKWGSQWAIVLRSLYSSDSEHSESETCSWRFRVWNMLMTNG